MTGHTLHRVRVPVPAEPERDYEVLIGQGLLAAIAGCAATVPAARRWAILTDATVGALYGAVVRASFEREGFDAHVITFEPGETSKTRTTWASLCDELFERGFGRDSGVVALGGGVVGDVAGFVAATYMRGIPLIQAPTTLLAMVDASVGGKTGIDVPAGKNLVGAFKWPAVVVTDPSVLDTLPGEVYRAGIAEAIKHAAIADASHLAWLAEQAGPLLRRDPDSLAAMIRRSVQIKAGVVGADPLETGRRAILNFGHTVAHALERQSNYRLSHGFAVAIGMVCEARIGERLGVTAAGSADHLAAVLSLFGLPVALPGGVRPEEIMAHARLDKKNRASRVHCALLARPGEPASTAGGWTFALSAEDLRAGLARP